MPSREAKACISYVCDVVLCAVTLLFLGAWVGSVHGSQSFSFSSQFMAAGFCNSSTFPTHWACVGVSALGAALLVALAATRWPAKLCTPVAGYMIAHGWGHFEVASGRAGPDHDTLDGDPVKLVLLALIVAIGPAQVSATLKTTGTSAAFANGFGLAIEGLVVGIFVFGIRRSVFALLYVNTSIRLCVTLPRLFLLGFSAESHISERVDGKPLFYTSLLSQCAVVATMCAEPTLCERGFAAAGGHIWFDVSLFVQALIATYNEAHQATASIKKD